MVEHFVLFDTLQGLALFFSLVTYLSALLSSSIYRLKTWFALILSCAVYCISFLLLVGQQIPDSNPPFALCLIQAGLIYAAPVTVASCGLSFVIELYWRLSYPLSQATLEKRKTFVLLLIAPVMHSIIFWITIVLGLSNHSLVNSDSSNLFCHLTSKIPTTITGITVVVCIVMMILVELCTCILLWRRRRNLSEIRANRSNTGFPLALFARVAIFTLIGGVGIILADVLLNAKEEGKASQTASYYALAIIPLAIAVVFGSQMDLLRNYAFWRKRAPQIQDQPRELLPASYHSTRSTDLPSFRPSVEFIDRGSRSYRHSYHPSLSSK